MRELARSADVSAASLSATEKGTSSPTLATLNKILRALGTNFAEFFAPAPAVGHAPVFPAAGQRTLQDAFRRYILLLPRREDFRFEIVHETIDPREIDPEWEAHECDLGGLVLSGGPAKLELAGAEPFSLRKGDSFYIPAGRRHRAVNLGRSPLKLITVMSPPRY